MDYDALGEAVNAMSEIADDAESYTDQHGITVIAGEVWLPALITAARQVEKAWNR